MAETLTTTGAAMPTPPAHTCSICGQPGHNRRTCPWQHARCLRCHRVGHPHWRCPHGDVALDAGPLTLPAGLIEWVPLPDGGGYWTIHE